MKIVRRTKWASQKRRIERERTKGTGRHCETDWQPWQRLPTSSACSSVNRKMLTSTLRVKLFIFLKTRTPVSFFAYKNYSLHRVRSSIRRHFWAIEFNISVRWKLCKRQKMFRKLVVSASHSFSSFFFFSPICMEFQHDWW